MNKRAISALVAAGLLAACNPSVTLPPSATSSQSATSSPTTTSPTTTSSPTPTSEIGSITTIQNILDLPNFAPLEAKTYYMDPDYDPSTPLRVMYTISEEGWLQWIGTFKPEDAVGEGRFVGVSISAVTNVMVDACGDQRPADPPIGPTVDDLAAALADLPPFQVTKTPTDVTIYGYSGKYLELKVAGSIKRNPSEVRPNTGNPLALEGREVSALPGTDPGALWEGAKPGPANLIRVIADKPGLVFAI